MTAVIQQPIYQSHTVLQRLFILSDILSLKQQLTEIVCFTRCLINYLAFVAWRNVLRALDERRSRLLKSGPVM